MGEIFRREVAENPEPFTGERITSAIGGQIQIEHYHRYLFARSLARGLDVLDVASGEGYGSALLAQVARHVVGVEYSGATVRTSRANFFRPNIGFLQADARALPLADDCIDLVVSFETIEHFDRQDEFLREIRRVLRPGGILIVSTPDRDVYSPLGAFANPYHAQELTNDEFIGLLRRVFPHVSVLRQRVMIGCALLADTGSSAPPLIFDRRGETHLEVCAGLPRAPYLLAVASERELPPLPASLYIDRSDLDSDRALLMEAEARLKEREASFTELATHLRNCDTEIATLRAHLADRAVRLEERVAVLAEREAHIMTLAARLAEREAGYSELSARSEELGLAKATVAELHRDLAQARSDRAQEVQRGMALEQQFQHLSGSFRSFMHGYLPRLYRHLLGRN